jgi:hypothetical protein
MPAQLQAELNRAALEQAEAYVGIVGAAERRSRIVVLIVVVLVETMVVEVSVSVANTVFVTVLEEDVEVVTTIELVAGTVVVAVTTAGVTVDVVTANKKVEQSELALTGRVSLVKSAGLRVCAVWRTFHYSPFLLGHADSYRAYSLEQQQRPSW